MIGVIANTSDCDTVQEFFELFKTPWEFYQPEQFYDVLLVSSEQNIPSVPGKLLIHYSSSKAPADDEGEAVGKLIGRNLSYKGWRVPIYRYSTTFKKGRPAFLIEEDTKSAAGYKITANGGTYVRVGYDLFREIQALLTVGQPPENASIPTVELHVAILRDLIVESGVRLVEIPPLPEGYACIACLTHDVDHPSIRLHKWDHTMWGFLYRAVIGSLIGVVRRRSPLRNLIINWAAASRLPFVHLGLARDFWYEFDRYLELEKGLRSTFFVLPFKGCPGRTISGPAPGKRASSYAAADIADKLQRVVSCGAEVGLHGIDAWIDSDNGQEEMAQIANIVGIKNIGVRMHWLYFNESAPAALERAGFSYDSTVGYNETIGYRAGTTQVYKPLQTRHLLELPLHVMDTALFYPAYLDCTVEDADKRLDDIINRACQFGGVVTFNWHDRSIAPERLWGKYYARLLELLKKKGAWCTSGDRAVSWFRNRRAITFNRTDQGLEIVGRVNDLFSDKAIAGFRLRIHNAGGNGRSSSGGYVDSVLNGNMNICLRESVITHNH